MRTLAEWWNRISLRTKITGVTVLLLTVGLLVAGVGTMTVLRSYLLDQVDAQLNATTLDIRAIDFTGTSDDPSCAIRTAPTDYFLAVVDADRNLLCSNRETGEAKPVVSDLDLTFASQHPNPVTLPSTTRGGEWRVVLYPAPLIDSSDYVTIVIGLDVGRSNATIKQFSAIFLFFGLTVVILGGALTRLLVTSTFTPLREVEATAARFADGDFNQRLAGATPNTEVGRLNRSLNAMLGRIDRAFADRARTIDQMRRFVGDASHELRTPLVSVRGYAELYRMGALTKPEDVAQAMARIEKEAIRMGELVEDLLELARIDEAKPLQLAEVDLVPLARDAALDAMAGAPDRVVTVVATDTPADPTPDPAGELTTPTVEMEVIPPTPARGVAASLATGPIAFAGATLARLSARRVRTVPPGPVTPIADPPSPRLRAVVLAEENKIRQVVANLIGNALRFTPAGSPIEIGVGVDSEKHVATISVIDHGEGIPPQIRGKIFERFWRADSSRQRATGGSGLGLAIVAAIVSAHHGDVEVVETPGGGATFRITLPLLPTASENETAPTSA